MEELNEICEILMEKCACSWVRDQTNEAHDKYSALKTQIQGKLFLMLIESFTPTYKIIKFFLLLFFVNFELHFTRHFIDHEQEYHGSKRICNL